jgi:putative membrane protein
MTAMTALHAGEPLRPHDLWTAWTFEPATMTALGLTGLAYAIGVRRVWGAAGVGRGVRQRDAWAFASGWLLLFLSQASPLHAAGGSLFSAHMIQHEILMTVAAPLLVIGKPLIAFVWALPPAWRPVVGAWSKTRPVANAWSAITHPLAAFTIHGAAIWVWHVPRLYDATVTNDAVHAAQHTSFLVTALLFWWVVLEPLRSRGNAPMSVAILYGTVLHTGALGALLTLTSRILYPVYLTTTTPWGLRPIDDQQLGGIIMWVPGGLAYVIAGLMVVARMLRDSGERVASGGLQLQSTRASSARRIRLDTT